MVVPTSHNVLRWLCSRTRTIGFAMVVNKMAVLSLYTTAHCHGRAWQHQTSCLTIDGRFGTTRVKTGMKGWVLRVIKPHPFLQLNLE